MKKSGKEMLYKGSPGPWRRGRTHDGYVPILTESGQTNGQQTILVGKFHTTIVGDQKARENADIAVAARLLYDYVFNLAKRGDTEARKLIEAI